MDTEQTGLSGSVLITIWSLIGAAVIAIGTYYGTEKNNKEQRTEDNNRIKYLESRIITLNKESQKKSDSIEKLTRKVLSFNKKIDTNTLLVKDVVSSIEELSRSTNFLSDKIKNEQRAKGEVVFEDKFDKYFLRIGMYTTPFEMGHAYSKKNTPIRFWNFKFDFTKKNNVIKFSTSFKDEQGKLYFEMKEGEWSIDRDNIYSFNYDSNGLELIDKNGHVIFQIDLIDDIFNISIMQFNEGRYRISRPNRSNKGLSIEDSAFENKFKNFEIPRIFQHNGENYLGKRDSEYVNNRLEKLKLNQIVQEEINGYRNLSEDKLNEIAKNMLVELKKYNQEINSDEWLSFVQIEDEYSTNYFDKGMRVRINAIFNNLYSKIHRVGVDSIPEIAPIFMGLPPKKEGLDYLILKLESVITSNK